MPWLKCEHQLLQDYPWLTHLIAVDEVGRGSIAGPVMACATLWRRQELTKTERAAYRVLKLVDDSKKLSREVREELFQGIDAVLPCALERVHFDSQHVLKPAAFGSHQWVRRAGARKKNAALGSLLPISCKLGAATAAEIDSINIWKATQIAAARALNALLSGHPEIEAQLHSAILLMDGKLFLEVPAPFDSVMQIAAVSGDSLFTCIGLSSVIAKVTRDRWMGALDQRYLGYGFGEHKGYGTRHHYEALKERELTPEHRRSFMNQFLSQEQTLLTDPVVSV